MLNGRFHQVAKRSFVPVLLGHAIDDDFIQPHHSDHIFDVYTGDKNIIKFDGDHNSPRPQFYFDSITIFFHNVLDPPQSNELRVHRMHDFFGQDNWDTIHEHEDETYDEPSGQELAPSGTEDAIAQLRSRRPMSRTEVPRDVSSQENNEDKDHEKTSNVGPSSTICPDNPANGGSYNWFSPISREGEYLEYSFDSYSDVPCSIEDEERMVMEAMTESLKDLEMRQQQDSQYCAATAATSFKSADDMEARTVQVNGPELAASSSSTSCSAADPQPREESENPTSCADAAEEREVDGSSSTSSSAQDADAAGGTRATLVVQKNPTGHIVEGLTRRWNFNFFKGNNQ